MTGPIRNRNVQQHRMFSCQRYEVPERVQTGYVVSHEISTHSVGEVGEIKPR